MFSQDPIEWPDEVEVLIDRLDTDSPDAVLAPGSWNGDASRG
jgi:hypothetical protein